jgi:metal-dependent amidase/aminoacylase/carboxypeptidase family protein
MCFFRNQHKYTMTKKTWDDGHDGHVMWHLGKATKIKSMLRRPRLIVAIFTCG